MGGSETTVLINVQRVDEARGGGITVATPVKRKTQTIS